MKQLVIQPQKEGKGRSFSALLVGCVEDRAVLPRGNDTTRPVFLALAGTENELRPFIANLRTGKKAEEAGRGRGERFEILKTAGFQCAWQRTSKGSLVTLFAPDLFCLDPGMVDPTGVRFVMLAATDWLGEAAPVELPDYVPADRKVHVMSLAPLFCAYLDRRTRCPLIPEPQFYARVFAAALNEGLAAFASSSIYRSAWGERSSLSAEGLDELCYAPVVSFRASHDALAELLAEEAKAFFGSKERRAAA